MKNALISIIIPTYNRVNDLRNALDSVFNQNYRPLEVVVVDDHGNDNTESMIKKLIIPHNVSIKYIYNSNNLGPGLSRNVGMKNASGEYIAFLDSDDYWIDKTKLEKQYLFLFKHRDYGFVGTRWLEIDGTLTNTYFQNPFQTDFSFRKIALFHYPVLTSTWFFRSSILYKTYGFWPFYSEDYEFLLRIGTYTKCYCLPIKSTVYNNVSIGFYKKNIIKQWLFGIIVCIKYGFNYPGFFSALLNRIFRAIGRGFRYFK